MELIAKLIEAGTPAALVAEVAMELGRAQAALDILESRRAKDRARKAVPRNSTESTESAEFQETPSSDKVSPQTPNQNNSIPSPPYSPPASRGTRLPDDFVMPGEWIEWAMAKRGWSRSDAEDEAECFARFWQAKAGRDAVKRDWFKTWQNWAVNSRRANQSTAPPSLWDGRA